MANEIGGLRELVETLRDEVGWLRQTRHEQMQQLARHEERFHSHDTQHQELREKDRELNGRLDSIDKTLGEIKTQLATVTTKIAVGTGVGALIATAVVSRIVG